MVNGTVEETRRKIPFEQQHMWKMTVHVNIELRNYPLGRIKRKRNFNFQSRFPVACETFQRFAKRRFRKIDRNKNRSVELYVNRSIHQSFTSLEKLFESHTHTICTPLKVSIGALCSVDESL